MNTETTYVSADERVIDFDDALARAWSKIRRAAKDGTDINKRKADGSARRYTTLAAVDEAIREALTAEGFTYPQSPSTRVDERGIWIVIHTQIRRKGVAFVPEPYALLAQGQMVKGGEGFKPATAQDMGSALTYARRYALTSVFGVCPDEDDDGHKASAGPKPDPIWDRFVDARTAVARHLDITVDQAYKRIQTEASITPQGDPTDGEVEEMTTAAKRLLQAPREPMTPGTDRKRTTAKGEQDVPVQANPTGRVPKADVTISPAWDAYAAAGKAYVDARIADYQDAEGKPPGKATEKSIRDAAIRIAAESCRLRTEDWPGRKATDEQLDHATAALVAARVDPYAAYVKAQKAYVDRMGLEYKRAEGEDPDADQWATYLNTALAKSAEAAGIERWPGRKATAVQVSLAVAALQGAA